MNKHILFCHHLIKGEIPCYKAYYYLDNSSNIVHGNNERNPDLTVISSIQDAVSQAGSDIRDQEKHK